MQTVPMNMSHRLAPLMKRSVLSALAGICLFTPASAQAPTLAMLDGLVKGEWELKFRGDAASRKLCLRTGRELIQLRHSATNCTRYVVEDGANEVTVQYTCPGDGYGRTNIRRETNALVQIDGQGIKGATPFQFSAEARRIGACS